MSSINPYLAIPVLKDGISVEIVNSFKDCGNDHFQKNKYSKAIDEYTQGIECFRHDHDTNEGFDDSLCSLLAYLYSNRAASYVKTLTMEYLTNGIRDANMCIKLRPTWLKGYYRRAESLFLMKEYRLAALDYQKALELDPQKSDTLLRKLRYCQAKDKEFDQKIIVHQISAQTEICKRGFNPIQNLIFTYAKQMQNFIYIVGDAASRECIVIDSCWDTTGIAKYAKANDLKIVGAAVTHCHFDHVGGIPPPPFDTLRIKVDGLYTLLKAFKGIKAYANPDDIQEIMKMNPSLETSDFVPTPDNFILQLPISEHSEESVAKTTSLRFIHTPGHTPGSQCILVNEISLFSGDTLFIGTCGRLDLPGSNKDLMWKSLSKLKYLPDLTTIYPGHSYNGSLTTIELEKKSGVLQIQEKDRFLAFFENTGA